MEKPPDKEASWQLPTWTREPGYLPSMRDIFDLRRVGKLDDFIAHNPLGSEFQIPTKEFVESLAAMLGEMIRKIEGDQVKILEVGAGNGRLAHFLKTAIAARTDKTVEYRAVDDYSWDDKPQVFNHPFWIRRLFPVEEISYDEALKGDPNIVVSSWMPHEHDWTQKIRSTESVKAFVLIGNDEKCGTKASWEADEQFKKTTPLVPGSVCWEDFAIPSTGSRTSTVALFERKAPQ